MTTTPSRAWFRLNAWLAWASFVQGLAWIFLPLFVVVEGSHASPFGLTLVLVAQSGAWRRASSEGRVAFAASMTFVVAAIQCYVLWHALNGQASRWRMSDSGTATSTFALVGLCSGLTLQAVMCVLAALAWKKMPRGEQPDRAQ
jgi:hypothetical protein